MLREFLLRLTQAMDAAGVEYMICGSVASIIHGVPRTTQDVDLVVVLEPDQVPTLLASFPEEDFYVSQSAAVDAVRRRSQFNVIHMQTAWKADLIVQKKRAFSTIEFGRRQRADVLGVEAWVASPEGTLLAKLEWGSKSGSERQLNDARGILTVSAEQLDWDYLLHWAEQLGVLPILTTLRSE